jgi:nicotinamidase-related amidase
LLFLSGRRCSSTAGLKIEHSPFFRVTPARYHKARGDIEPADLAQETAIMLAANRTVHNGMGFASMNVSAERRLGVQFGCATGAYMTRWSSGTSLLAAEPDAIEISWPKTALIIIDMQRDFLEPGGFGETLGNDVSLLQSAVAPCKSVLQTARENDLLVVHTREGHLPDLSDAPPAKIARGAPSLRIGDPGPMGRILIRGEEGHDIIPALYPVAGEIVIDKPGKGAFYATALDSVLKRHHIDTLLVCGVTTEVCVNTTVREANDRGYRCVVLADCCASYFPHFHDHGLQMIKAQGGIFGWVSSSRAVLEAIDFQPLTQQAG